MKIQEGCMPFLGFKTYYRIAGECTGNRKPLLLLHGGPGSTHNYFEVLDCLAEEGRAIISYDQIGCGRSFVEGHEELFCQETWMQELDALIEFLHLDHYHLLGQSWGGMLAIAHAIEEKPEGLSSLILSSTLSSSRLWAKEQHRMIRYMSREDQDAIREAEETGDFSSEAYLKANEHFMELHCAGPYDSTSPECLTREKKAGALSYLHAWGPNEYNPTGTLKDFDYTDRLKEIRVPSLICSGTDDLCTPLVAKTMYDRIPDSQWQLFPYARHMCFVDCHEQYCRILNKWMCEHD
ncbi:MAG: proline iminopeptidase-family hydrolase [Bulleidia sp.]|nr:proline iminopeptidase-family hydrolase [Bulleidia sp.]